MAVPKHKPSKSRSRHRRSANNRAVALHRIACSNCDNSMIRHRVCPACGYYRDRQVLEVK